MPHIAATAAWFEYHAGMPATFLLVTLVAALGAISPLFLAASLIFCFTEKFHRLGLVAVKSGTAAGVLFILIWAALTFVFISHADHRWLSIAIFFGAGFVLGSGLVLAAHMFARRKD